ncbi:hypothetical protein FACS1894159_02120 [Bacteroidia bacterium]|nr:hypothetical protein FACS1894159_02120 [Bacteroidia bacterium]
MNLQEELLIALQRELAREKRLTYIAYGLIAVVALLVVIFLGGIILGSVMGEEVPLYPKIMVVVALVAYIGYAVWKIMQLNKRDGQLERLFGHLASGARATGITETKEYKIIIPLGKVTYKMCPVEHQIFALDIEPMNLYTVAVPRGYATDLKNLLSGADMEAIARSQRELYAAKGKPAAMAATAAGAVAAAGGIAGSATAAATASAEAENTAAQLPDNDAPLKSVDEFRSFLGGEMGDQLAQLEAKRASSRKTMRILGLAAGAVAAIWVGYIIYSIAIKGGQLNPMQFIVPMIVLCGGYYVVYFMFLKPKNVNPTGQMAAGGLTPGYELKSGIIERIVKFISPGAQFVMHGHISRPEMMASGLFSDGHYTLSGSDLVIGKYRGVPFQFCNLAVEVEKRVKEKNEGPSYAFYGQFFVARFNKPFSSTVTIAPRTGLKGFFSDSETSLHIHSAGDKVQLEDPEFMKMFSVRAEDQIEARYILTPALMERIKQMALRTKGAFYICFHRDNITVANNNGKSSFVVDGKKSFTDNNYQTLIDFYNEIGAQFGLIDELKLNIKIWG